MFLSYLSPTSRSRRIARVIPVAALAIALVPLAHCTSSEPAAPPSTLTIGPGGGALASSDYIFEISIPPGALSADVTFTITPVNTPGTASTYSPSYAITPAGQTFAAPVVLSFSEEGINFNGTNDLSDYRVAGFVSGAWAQLANPSVDTLAATVEGTTTAIAGDAYSVIVPAGGSCVAVTESCSSGEDAGDEAGACSATCGVSYPPTVPGKCAAYAGSVSGACNSDGGTTISVSCCYPTGSPICFTELEPDGCGSPCLQFPGSTAVSCVPDVGPPIDDAPIGGLPQSTCCFASGAPVCMASHVSGSPAPRCAATSATACAAYPGTTVASCTDVGDGTLASCCLPVGTLPGILPSPSAASVDGGAVTGTGDAGGSGDAGGIGNADAGGSADGGGIGLKDSGGVADANGGVDAGDSGAADAGEDGD